MILVYFSADKNSKTGDPITIEIVKGESVRQITSKLQDKGLIKSKNLFYLEYIKKRKPLQSGIYLLHQGDRIKDIYEKIAGGKIDEEKIVVVEGWRREQIAQLLNRQKIVNYEEFMAVAEGKEGKLFPDTYRVEKKTSAEVFTEKMLKNYQLKTKDLAPSDDQLIIASIVEREAKKDEDRAVIAGVFYNRLAKGMKLEADPTVQYGLDNERLDSISASNIDSFDFWQALEPNMVKSVVSPFNTYRINGLPPAPISNPGLKSIEAAVKPAKTDYYYFLTDQSGKAHFAKNKSEHDENIKRYLN